MVNIHRSAILALIVVSACSVFARPACAAPTDIVPSASALLDCMAGLAAYGYLGADVHPVDFTSDRQFTREQLAHYLETGLLSDNAAQTDLNKVPQLVGLERELILGLRPELQADNIDIGYEMSELAKASISYTGKLQAEGDIRVAGDPNPKSNVLGIYRGVIVSQLSSNIDAVVDLSDAYREDRLVFTNDIGDHDFEPLNEAYVTAQGGRGLVFTLGKINDNWGAGSIGSTLLSDNAPPLTQGKVEFPFSLGHVLGRNYRYSQLLAEFRENGSTRYFQARRIEYAFSPRLNFQYEEALKSSTASVLQYAYLPFLVSKGIHLRSDETETEFIGNFGLSYDANPIRFYGQFLINDLKQPLPVGTKVLGFDLNDGGHTPRRIAYLLGSTLQVTRATTATVEYTFSDPTTYLYQNNLNTWTEGTYDYLGLPDGNNSSELSGSLHQRFSSRLSGFLDARDRMRDGLSYPTPTSRLYSGGFDYRVNARQSAGFTYEYYDQDPFPIAVGAKGYPLGDGDVPIDESNAGERLRIREVQLRYTFQF